MMKGSCVRVRIGREVCTIPSMSVGMGPITLEAEGPATPSRVRGLTFVGLNFLGRSRNEKVLQLRR